ncbi:MAG TPA: hypothetical protein VMH04_23160 [Candidatus Solibacter sp.]|nr:hypothetical protein [Candidatus Solibacter sp.]
MNRKFFLYIFSACAVLGLGLLTGCSSSSSSSPKTTAISVSSGSGQSATVSTGFTNPLVAIVTLGGSPVSGASVTFTAPSSGASGTFSSNGTATETDTTDATGKATSSAFAANSTSGTYSVTATTSGATSPANFSLTNSAVTVTANTYVFYLAGEELINFGPNYYAVVGAVQIDASGNILGGEQDYNDAFGLTFSDAITATNSALVVDSTTGQGTLTITTADTSIGVNGVETLGVQFVNSNHALVMQFDGTATSSGSMDLQTLPSSSDGNYAFTVAGVDPNYNPAAFAGVFTISGTSLSGTSDFNDAGFVSTGVSFSGTLSAADTFGKGTVTGIGFNGAAYSYDYFLVGPGTIRLIAMDATDSLVGSAYGQGAGTFNNASLSSTVLALSNNPWSSSLSAIGQFSTSNTSSDPASFAGVGEDDELDNGFVSALAVPTAGTYSIASNGYGSLALTGGIGGGNVSLLGVYMVDPALNINDPNNTNGGGGALIIDLDSVNTGAVGVMVPQTDTTNSDLTGNYAAGWQDFNYFNTCTDCEFDMMAQGALTSSTISLTGLVSDPFFTLGTPDATSSGDTFTGTPLVDGTNAGRYSMLSTNVPANSLAATIDGASGGFDLVMYQASGGQLFWMNYDPGFNTVFSGPIEQQGSLTGIPAARRSMKLQAKKH